MHGIIFSELKKYVDTKAGKEAWDGILRGAGLPAKTFLSTQEYPDGEAAAIVTSASNVTGRPVSAILEDFGEFIVPDLVAVYGGLIRAEWKTLDLIENTESVIHKTVRLKNPGAKPPELKCTRVSPDEVQVQYSSHRKMCGVAKGIAKGVARHYRESITVHETSCISRGDPSCNISVRRA